MWTLTARWIFPVDGPPLAHGTVCIDGERLVAVEPQGSRAADRDLGNAAVLPGLVNAHTHLDLSGMHGLVPPSPDFTDWLKQVIAFRRQRSLEQVREDIRSGLRDCLRYGTTLIGDISAVDGSWSELAAAPLRAVVFHECLGLTRLRAVEALNTARDWLGSHSATPTCRPGLSPHAPYSVHAELFEGLAQLARDSGVPLATHLAETRSESQLLTERSGPFVPFLQSAGAWEPEGLAIGPEAVLRRTAVAPHLLLIHGNYLEAVELPPHATIVYCPRTHAAFGHVPHPFRNFLARGIRVAIGTDSLASNPDLDLLAEIRFLHRQYPDVSGAALLRMATLAGAEALGWADETGSLTPGKSADLVVVPIDDRDQDDPYQLLLRTDQRASAVLFRGRWLVPVVAD